MNRTKRNIIDAFNRLIMKMQFESITTSMIIKEAMISRSTFYRYFMDKYDVMNSNYKLLLDQSIENSSNYHEMFIYMFDSFEKQWKKLLNFFDSTGINSLANYICKYSISVAEEVTRQNRNGNGPTPEERLQLDLFCYGLSQICKKWIQGEYSLTVSQIADLSYDMAPETLKYYWFIEK